MDASAVQTGGIVFEAEQIELLGVAQAPAILVTGEHSAFAVVAKL